MTYEMVAFMQWSRMNAMVSIYQNISLDGAYHSVTQ